jgi:hypothetical protein
MRDLRLAAEYGGSLAPTLADHALQAASNKRTRRPGPMLGEISQMVCRIKWPSILLEAKKTVWWRMALDCLLSADRE